MNTILREAHLLRENFKPIKHDKLIVAGWILSGFILLMTLIFLIAKTRAIGFEIPVRYNPYTKTTGNGADLLKMPLLGICIYFINGILATKYYNSERLISYILTGILVAASFMLTIQSFLFVYLLGVR